MREKESKLLSLQEEQKGDYIKILPTNNRSVMLQIFTMQRKNKSIILHSFPRKTRVSCYITFFQTLLKTFFFWPLLWCNWNSNEQTVKLNTEQFSKWRRRTDVSYGFNWNASSHANKMFLNGNAIADELPNIQFSLTTVRDASLPGIQTYFIYSLRIIGKPSLISIEKFGFWSKFSLYSSRIIGKPSRNSRKN